MQPASFDKTPCPVKMSDVPPSFIAEDCTLMSVGSNSWSKLTRHEGVGGVNAGGGGGGRGCPHHKRCRWTEWHAMAVVVTVCNSNIMDVLRHAPYDVTQRLIHWQMVVI
jgi:hypothetical protein